MDRRQFLTVMAFAPTLCSKKFQPSYVNEYSLVEYEEKVPFKNLWQRQKLVCCPKHSFDQFGNKLVRYPRRLRTRDNKITHKHCVVKGGLLTYAQEYLCDFRGSFERRILDLENLFYHAQTLRVRNDGTHIESETLFDFKKNQVGNYRASPQWRWWIAYR